MSVAEDEVPSLAPPTLATDVLVVGAGPAGATAALNLAGRHRVVLVDRQEHAAARIGESLAPAARRLLTDMGLWRSFLAQGHAPCHANRAVWGDAEPVVADRLRDLDGPGWHLDRARFDGWLRGIAVARGAALLCPAEPVGVAPLPRGGWRVELAGRDGQRAVIEAPVLIEAGGRQAPLARRLGARRRAADRLVCGWVHGRDADPAAEPGLTRVQAVEDGWWYTAPLPGGRRVLAFQTDSDLPAARLAGDAGSLVAAARATPDLGGLLALSGFVAEGAAGFTAAHSALLDPVCGPCPTGPGGWLAAGDAATGFDPLSSQGLFNALYTGLSAAESAHRLLAGDDGALDAHAAGIAGIWRAYGTHLSLWYGEERRWPDHPFWARRIG